jgi:hypothetical protein
VTKHTIVNFQLARSGVAMIAGGAALVGVLLAGAGYIGGLKSSPKAAAAPPPAPAAPPPPPKAAHAPPAQTFSLRVKTVFSEPEAKAEQAALQEKQIDAVIVALPPADGAAMFAIETGRYPTHDAAVEASIALAEQKHVRTAVVAAAPLPKPPG